MQDWIGKTLGKVVIEQRIGRGGMAEVYRGTHTTLQRTVAVKILHGFLEDNADLHERFQREARVAAGLRHPNIVQVFDFDLSDGQPFIVMEYVNGPSLSAYLRSLHERQGRVPIGQIARLLPMLSSALDYAHSQGIVHRDIKPGNILLYSRTQPIRPGEALPRDAEPMLSDFGLVRVMDSATQTSSGLITGTPAYMSPEQARGDRVDYRTDVYSLGVILTNCSRDRRRSTATPPSRSSTKSSTNRRRPSAASRPSCRPCSTAPCIRTPRRAIKAQAN